MTETNTQLKNMNQVLNIYKKAGETPLEAINRLRAGNPEFQKVKITYAGRLDPLAEGVLILLAGDAIYEKEKYLKLDKEYEAEILFGFETDTYDILGVPKKNKTTKTLNKNELNESLKLFLGKNKQPFPPYSSYKIKGKPLFEWAREGRLKEIEVPEKEREVYEIKLIGLRKIKREKLLAKINKKMKKVKGDFRQLEILNKWNEILTKEFRSDFQTVKLSIKCSSGTYIRSIAHNLGKGLETGAILSSLKRVRVGEFKIQNCIAITDSV